MLYMFVIRSRRDKNIVYVQLSKKSSNIESTIHRKVAPALHKSKGITKNSYIPKSVIIADFGVSSGFIIIW